MAQYERGNLRWSESFVPQLDTQNLAGLKIRVPDGEMFRDLFATLGATPVTINIRDLYDGLKTRKVDGQENPLVITEVNKLYEVTKYVSVTHHMWSGFNLLANLKFWNALPADIQAVIDRGVVKYVAMQRKYTDDLSLPGMLVGGYVERQGMIGTDSGTGGEKVSERTPDLRAGGVTEPPDLRVMGAEDIDFCTLGADKCHLAVHEVLERDAAELRPDSGFGFELRHLLPVQLLDLRA